MEGSHKNSSKKSAKNSSSKKNGSDVELRTAVKLIEYYKLWVTEHISDTKKEKKKRRNI